MNIKKLMQKIKNWLSRNKPLLDLTKKEAVLDYTAL